jgi:photosystem II stability/assembly factor-like uncharacterized protein
MQVSPVLAAILLATATLQAAVAAQPVADALQRPALAVREPARAVLLAAAAAGERLVAVGERGLVVLSDDQGASWRQAPSPVSVTLTAVRFADARHGVAVGHGGVVLATGDAGATWTLRLDGRRVAELAAAAADTTELQREAERLQADGPDKPFLDVLLWDAQRWLVAGAFGLVFETRDAGRSWQPLMHRLPNPRGLHWYVLRRQGDTLLLAGEQGLLARSSDGGATFQALESPYRGSWFSGEILSDGEWLLGGLRGNLWRGGSPGGGVHGGSAQSTPAGAAWRQLPSPVPSSVTALVALPGGQAFVATQAGLVLQLQDGTLKPLNRDKSVPMPSALLPLRDGRLLSVGMAGIVPVPTAQVRQP